MTMIVYFAKLNSASNTVNRGLVGGGLIRSLGGWSEVKKVRSKGQTHMMSDERIFGDSEFVDSVLSEAG